MNTDLEEKARQLNQYFKKSEEKEAEEKKISKEKKYDPYRRYRKGDIVRARLYGRKVYWAEDGQIFHVAEDEKAGSYIKMQETWGGEWSVLLHYSEIELVKPIEENKPFDLDVIEAVRRMTDDHKIMERPVPFRTCPLNDFRMFQMRFYDDAEEFQTRFVGLAKKTEWQSCYIKREDIEAKWREAEEQE